MKFITLTDGYLNLEAIATIQKIPLMASDDLPHLRVTFMTGGYKDYFGFDYQNIESAIYSQ